MADFSLNLDEAAVGTPAYGDVVMRDGDVLLTAPTQTGGTDATLQLVCTRLRLFLGEWFLNTSDGVGYLQILSTKTADASDLDAAVKNTILGTPGVVALTQYQGSAFCAQRLYKITFTIVTATGGTQSATVPVGV